jgi:TonB family protein
MACSGRGDSIPFMVSPATYLAWFRAAPLKPSVGRLSFKFGVKTVNIKQLAYTFIVLLILGLIEAPTEAHNQRRHCRPRPVITKSSDVQAVDIGTTDERDKIIEECERPDRLKPEGEIIVVSPLCGKAISLPKPRYPKEVKDAKISGVVQVDVVIDEMGRVTWAQAATGHPLLQGVSRRAACRARYSPTRISGRPVKTGTSITYNFELR